MDQNNMNNGFNQNNFNNMPNESLQNNVQTPVVDNNNGVYVNTKPKSMLLIGFLFFIMVVIAGFGTRAILMIKNAEIVIQARDDLSVRTFKMQLTKMYTAAQSKYLTESISGNSTAFEVTVGDTYICYMYDLDSLGMSEMNSKGSYYGTVGLCKNNDGNVDKGVFALSSDKYHTDGLILYGSSISDDVVKDGIDKEMTVYCMEDMSESDIQRLTNDLSNLVNK